MAWMETEREAMVRTLHGTDPQAPTLCEGWNVSRLLAHLVMREERPWMMVGDAVRRDKPGHEHSLNALAAQAGTEPGYRELVDRFAAGAQGISPMRWGGDAVNLLEFFVHHEDIRRGTGEAAPRGIPAGEEAELRRRLPLMARMGYLRSPVGVVVQLPGGEQARVRRGDAPVTITGPVTELALHAMGRRSAARVEISGAPGSVDRFRSFAGA
ncbi:TIGR03085 family metal-binding protein [Arthrobacter koreensis]|uniref:TIGR03085 family metal-binding protein n=1 Tax=Arthrobacter koreensis TaxID=199136 RepID=UPI002DBD2344|nr:TIGR03085 family metal-binding protein [Arthrobacter koreensis]MEB7504437.1 TIGR03085 family metal-binding protein [Arthrobacter koreensis]